MASTLEELEARVEALEWAQTTTPTQYYTSKYSGEEMDALLGLRHTGLRSYRCRMGSFQEIKK